MAAGLLVVEGVEEVEGATEALKPVPLPTALRVATPTVLLGDTLGEGLEVMAGLTLPTTPEGEAHTPVPLTVRVVYTVEL